MKKFIIKIVVAVIIAAGFMVGAIFLMNKGLMIMWYEYRRTGVLAAATCFSFTALCSMIAVECIKIAVKNIIGLFEYFTAKEIENDLLTYERLTKSRIRLVFIENVAGQKQTEFEINGIKQSILYNRLAELEDMIESGELKVSKEADAERHIIPTETVKGHPTETVKEHPTEKNEPKNADESDPVLVIKDYKFSDFFEMCKNRENCEGCELANPICPCAICGDKNKYMCEKCKMKEWDIAPCVIPTILRNSDGKIILEKGEANEIQNS